MNAWTCPSCGKVMASDARLGANPHCPACDSQLVDPDEHATVVTGEIDLPRPFGKYVLLERVGSGGTACVYMARDASLDRVVAIKIPHAGGMLSTEERSRFLRESRTVAQLRHPNIVQVYEVGQVEGTPYLATEFVRGCTVKELVANRRLNFADIALFVSQIAYALEHAHSKDVVHRDVKPSNIMVDIDGNPRLMDFGLAKSLAGEPTITTDGQILGTPAFMSPEQAAGKSREADHRSDIYGLGTVLYTLLTRQPPFEGNYRWILLQVLSTEPARPRSIDKSIPKDLETICLKAMNKEAHLRYSSAAAFGEDLRRFIGGQTILARPAGTIEKTVRWSRQHPTVAGLATAVAFLLVFIAVGSFTAMLQFRGLANRESKARQDAEEALERNRQLLVSMNVTQGARQLAAGRSSDSLPWFLEAMRLDVPENQDLHRLRLGMILDHCAKPMRLWRFDTGCRHAIPSPDGSSLLITCHDGSARLVDIFSGKAISPVVHQAGAIHHANFSSDGQTVLTTSWQQTGGRFQGELRLWNPRTGALLRSPVQLDKAIHCAELSEDGSRFLAGTTEGLYVWSARDGQPSQFFPAGSVHHAIFHPNGTRICVGGMDGSLALWSLESKQRLHHCEPHDGPISALRFSPDGKTLASASGSLQSEGSVCLWDVPSWSQRGSKMTHLDAISAVDFHPEGNTILTASRDGTARVWGIASGQPVGTSIHCEEPIVTASFSPDGEQMLTVSGTPSGIAHARVWNVRSRTPVTPPMNLRGSVGSAGFTKDQTGIVVASGDGTTWLWNLITCGQSRSLFPQIDGDRIALTVIRGNRLMGVSASGDLAVLDLTQPTTPATFHVPFEHTSVAALSTDGQWGFLASTLNQAVLLDLKSKRPVGMPWTLPGRMTGAEFLPSGQGIMLVSDSGKVSLLRLDSRAIRELDGGPVTAVTCHPVDDVLFAVHADNRLRVWQAESGRCLNTVACQAPISDLRIADNGAFMASTNGDGKISLWQLGGEPKILHKVTSGVRSIFCLSPDGTKLACGGLDGLVKIWDTATGQVSGLHFKHPTSVTALHFSRRARLLVTAGSDRQVRIWCTATGAPLSPALPLPETSPSRILLTKDRKGLLTVSRSGLVSFWDLRTLQESIEVAAKEARLVSGLVMNDAGNVIEHESADRFADYQSITANPGHPFEVNPRCRREWHEVKATEYSDAKNWPTALFHWNQLVDLEPKEPSYRARRGQVHANRSDWDAAKADFLQAIELESKDPDTWRCAALAALVTQEDAVYQKICQSMYDTFGRSDNVETIFEVARTCTLGVNPFAADGRIAALTAQVIAAQPMDRYAHAVHAIALYRCGRYEEAVAVASVDTSSEQFVADDLLARGLPAFRKVICAMAAHRTGDEKALAVLQTSAAMGEFVVPLSGCPWQVQAELTILGSEVQAMLARKR